MVDQEFVRNVGIMVIAAACFALGARACSLPTIVAYLVAGLLLGPLTGLVELSSAIHLVAEAGIVLLLFLVGLELSLDRIKGVGPVVLVAGGAQVGLTMIGGFALGIFLGFAPVPALILGMALSFSSTVIVVKLLVDQHATSRPYGQIAIGILLVQDLVVILLLTLINGLPAGEDSLTVATVVSGVGRAFGGMLILLLVVLAVSKWVLPTPFIWAARSPETLFIWSLCWCFLVVSATHVLHLSAEIGAFVAGISLAQLPYNRDLQRRVQPLMNFFIAVFFVSLGIEMKIDVTGALWAKAVLLAVFVVVGKFTIIMFIVARLAYSEKTAYFAALHLTQVSEFSFIIMALGAKAGLVPSEATILLGLVGLLSISVSTVAIVYREVLYQFVKNHGILAIFGAGASGARERQDVEEQRLEEHVIIVGMNALGRELSTRLHEKGETVLAVDVDPGKLARVPVRTLLGDAESVALLEDAGLEKAKLLVSTLHIEGTNDLLAFRCRQAGVRCAIHAVDLSDVDNLLEMEVDYLLVPKADGLKLQNQQLERMGYLRR